VGSGCQRPEVGLTGRAQRQSVGEGSGSKWLDFHRTVDIRLVLIRSRRPDLGWTSEIQRPATGLGYGGVARSHGEVSHETRGRPWRGSRGLGKDSGAFRATWRTKPWAQRRRGGTIGHRTRRGGPSAARTYSDEQSSEDQGNKQRNRGARRLLTSRGNHGGNGVDAGTPWVDGGRAPAARGGNGLG
jgi:hypothetical protein